MVAIISPEDDSELLDACGFPWGEVCGRRGVSYDFVIKKSKTNKGRFGVAYAVSTTKAFASLRNSKALLASLYDLEEAFPIPSPAKLEALFTGVADEDDFSEDEDEGTRKRVPRSSRKRADDEDDLDDVSDDEDDLEDDADDDLDDVSADDDDDDDDLDDVSADDDDDADDDVEDDDFEDEPQPPKKTRSKPTEKPKAIKAPPKNSRKALADRMKAMRRRG